MINMETQQNSAPVSVAAKSYAASSPAPSPAAPTSAPAPAPAAAVARAPSPPRTRTPSSTPAPDSVQREPSPPLSEKAAPSTSTVANGSSPSASTEELASLRKQNEKLQAELAERDTLIRELELKLERVKVRSPARTPDASLTASYPQAAFM